MPASGHETFAPLECGGHLVGGETSHTQGGSTHHSAHAQLLVESQCAQLTVQCVSPCSKIMRGDDGGCHTPMRVQAYMWCFKVRLRAQHRDLF